MLAGILNLSAQNSTQMHITINETVLEVALEENDAISALLARLQEDSITYISTDYGDFESIGDIGFCLTGSEENITTMPGDVCLYKDNHICIFYGSNTGDYTKIGHITNSSQAELSTLLGTGAISITLSVEK